MYTVYRYLNYLYGSHLQCGTAQIIQAGIFHRGTRREREREREGERENLRTAGFFFLRMQKRGNRNNWPVAARMCRMKDAVFSVFHIPCV